MSAHLAQPCEHLLVLERRVVPLRRLHVDDLERVRGHTAQRGSLLAAVRPLVRAQLQCHHELGHRVLVAASRHQGLAEHEACVQVLGLDAQHELQLRHLAAHVARVAARGRQGHVRMLPQLLGRPLLGRWRVGDGTARVQHGGCAVTAHIRQVAPGEVKRRRRRVETRRLRQLLLRLRNERRRLPAQPRRSSAL